MALNDDESASIMVNEEDHLRVQVMRSGFALLQAWEQIDDLDNRLEEHLDIAFSQELGYLSACPTNVGTGIRVGVMLHLPALGQTNHLDKFFRALQKINLSVRGLHGEGTQPYGDFYQISNQQTLGKSESELIKSLSDVIPQLIEYERKARQTLLTEPPSSAPRPSQPGLWCFENSPYHLKRRDHAPALKRANGNQSGPYRRS